MTTYPWTISYDPLRLLCDLTDLAQLEESARTQGEDILQATRVQPGKARQILDLGWYRDRYRVHLVEDKNWSVPVRTIESPDLRGGMAAFRSLMT